MSRPRLPIVLASLAAIVATAGYFRPRDEPRAPTPTPTAGASTARLEAEIARLRADISAVRHADPAAVRDGTPAPQDAERVVPPEEPPPVLDQEQTLAWLDGALDAESDDPVWSRSTEATITTIVGDHGVGSHLDRVSCRTTMCRLEIRHDSDAARQGFLTQVLVYPPFDGAGMAVPTGDPLRPDDMRTVVYLARKDHALPL